MGIYDRDYYQESERKLNFSPPRTMVMTLILINVGVYLLDFLTQWRLSQWGELHSDFYTRPWESWQLLTSGFLHDKDGILHIVFNMLVLWMFGREVEVLYGKWEFLRMYLVFLVLSSLGWAITEQMLFGGGTVVGASGAITGILVVYVFNFPRRVLYLFGVVPIPAWALLLVLVLLDLQGFVSGGRDPDDRTAFAAHLSGALCGFAYFRSGINFGRLLPKGLKMPNLGGSRLRLHDPERDERELNVQVDAILQKIHQHGEASLSKKERRTLESASRRFQQRRR